MWAHGFLLIALVSCSKQKEASPAEGSASAPAGSGSATAPAVPGECATGSACFDLGKALTGSDPAGAVAAYERGCAQKSSSSCFNAALLYRDGKLGKPDPAKTSELMEKGCAIGNSEACWNVGLDYLEGVGVAKDAEKGIKLVTIACDAGEMKGCLNLGFVHRDFTKDLPKAFAAFSKACELGEVNGCYKKAIAQARGLGTTKDVATALPELTKACTENASYCEGLADLTEKGDGVPKDRARARELFKKACEAGDEKSCGRAENP